jgi:hypothetical protein
MLSSVVGVVKLISHNPDDSVCDHLIIMPDRNRIMKMKKVWTFGERNSEKDSKLETVFRS